MITRLVCGLLLVIIAVQGARATHGVIGACFAFDGATARTSYIDGGGGIDYYPVHNVATAEQDGQRVTVNHRVVFERRGLRVYLPGVMR